MSWAARPGTNTCVTATWYYEANGAAQGPFTREQMRDLVTTGTLTRETKVWTGSLKKWLPAGDTTLDNLFKTAPPASVPASPESSSEPPSAPAPSPVTLSAVYAPVAGAAAARPLAGFRSPRLLAHGITALFVAVILLAMMGIWFGLERIELLDRVQEHHSVAQAEVVASNARFETVRTARWITLCTAYVVFLCWVYLVAKNVRALGAQRLRFSPEGAVGYYFVPIGSLWLPYQAMKELWKASEDPEHWRSVRTAPIVGWWWGLLIGTSLLSYFLIRFMLLAGARDPAFTTRLDIASCFVGLPLEIAMILLVQMVSAVQMRSAKTLRSGAV